MFSRLTWKAVCWSALACSILDFFVEAQGAQTKNSVPESTQAPDGSLDIQAKKRTSTLALKVDSTVKCILDTVGPR